MGAKTDRRTHARTGKTRNAAYISRASYKSR